MRTAIGSSPRSGNSWVRSVLASILRLEQIAVHNYRDVSLSAGSLHPVASLVSRAQLSGFSRKYGFRVVVATPLDVLVSVLAFVRHEPLTGRWLEGNCEIPAELIGSPPASRAFARYATGFGAENLLSVSYQWWQGGDALKIRYDDFNRVPKDSFEALFGELGEVRRGSTLR